MLIHQRKSLVRRSRDMADGSFHDLLGVSSTPEQSVRSRPLSSRDRFADLLISLDMPPKEAYAVLDKIGDSPFGALVEGFGAISPSGISETGAKIREQHEEPSIFDTPTEKATKFGENRLKDLVFGVGLAAGGSGAGGGGKVIFNKFMERLRKKTLTDKELYQDAVTSQKMGKKVDMIDEVMKEEGFVKKGTEETGIKYVDKAKGTSKELLDNLDDLERLKRRDAARRTIQRESFERGETDSLGLPKATKKPLLLTKEMKNQATFILNYQDAKLHVRPWKEKGLMSLYDNHNKRVSPYFEKSEDMYKWFSENYGKPK